jgi:glycosyltransferase involved in cell wall biosynthesis
VVQSSTALPPLVGVIIATRRGGPFLDEALSSLEAQTYPRIDAVVVDDGSARPDDVAAVTRRHPTVRLVRQPNAGSSVARNYGVSLTRGEFLAFLDDDDRWHPQRIARQVEALLANPGAVVSYCGMRVIDDVGAELLPADQRQVDDVHEILRRSTGILLPNVLIRRETFARVGGFHPSFRRAQDLDLVLKAAHEGDFVFVPETLVDYRRHIANSTRGHHELCRSIDRIVRLHRWAAQERGRQDLVRDHTVSLAANARFAVWTAARVTRGLVHERRYGAALREISWAVRFAPAAPLSAVRKRLPGRSALRRTGAARRRAAPPAPAPETTGTAADPSW